MTEPAEPPQDPRLDRLTSRAGLDQLAAMTLELPELPPEFRSYHRARSGPVDNARIAWQSFHNTTAADVQRQSRQGGYIKEFAATAEVELDDGLNLAVATSVHLFDRPESVAAWLRDQFLGQFAKLAGQPLGSRGAQLISARPLPDPAGFYDRCAALKAVQGGPGGVFSASIVNFRLGRLLGCALIGVLGDHDRAEPAADLARRLERNMVRTLLN